MVKLLRMVIKNLYIKCFLLSKLGYVHMSEVRRHLKFLHADTKIWYSIADKVILPMGWPRRRYHGSIADRVRYFCLLQNVWTGFGAHPNYWAVFPWGMKHTINPSVVLSLRMDGTVSPHTCPYFFMELYCLMYIVTVSFVKWRIFK